MSVWWLRIIDKLGRINPGDPMTHLNMQDLFDILQQVLGG